MSRSKTPFFERIPGDPEPIGATITRRVQFHDLDPMNIVWHGRYPEFLEAAHIALSHKCGFSYPQLRESGVMTPIHTLHLEYLAPLRYNDLFTVAASVIWSDSARINVEYKITKEDGTLASSGYSVQLFTDALTGEPLFLPPPIWSRFLERWKAGEFYDRR